MKRIVLFITFFFLTFISFSQVSNKDLKIKEEILKYEDSLFIPDFNYNIKWYVKGMTYDTKHSLLGFSFSNGLKEKPILHFEDLQADILYYINAQTDFKNDYSLKFEFGLNDPFSYSRFLPFNHLFLEYIQRDLKLNDFFQRDFNIKSRIGFNLFNFYSSLLVDFGHQTLRNNKNFGVSVGWQKSHKIYSNSSSSSFYYGFLIGNYKEYNNYSIFLHSFLFKNKMSFRLSYDKINRTDFLNIGLNLVFYKFKQK